MDERSCYLVFDYNTNTYNYNGGLVSMKFRHEMEKVINRQITAEERKFIEQAFSSPNPQNNQLTMLKLTDSEAREFIRRWSEQPLGITLRIQSYEIEIDNANSSGNLKLSITPDQITSDVNNMKQYLKDIYLLEKDIYCSKVVKQQIVIQ